jgi:hypothetical protein
MNERRDFLLKRRAAVVLSLGMILPEYLLLVTVSAFLAMTILAAIQTIMRSPGTIANRQTKMHDG